MWKWLQSLFGIPGISLPGVDDWKNIGADAGGLIDYVTEDKFPHTGTLPFASRLEGRFVRYHHPDYLKLGDELWKTFADGPWKWKVKERYAGVNINCGHYFSLATAGADAEVEFYKLKYAGRPLLEIQAEFANILDLTYEENIRAVFEQWVADRHNPAQTDYSNMQLVGELVNVAEGGNDVTDLIGYHASRKGYDGILFFGARAIEPVRHAIDRGYDDDRMGWTTAPEHFRTWRKEPAYQNLVIFSGLNLIRSISAVWVNKEPTAPNPYFQADLEKLNSLTEYNTDDYEERLDRILFRRYSDVEDDAP